MYKLTLIGWLKYESYSDSYLKRQMLLDCCKWSRWVMLYCSPKTILIGCKVWVIGMTHTTLLSIKRGLVFHRKMSCSTGHYFTLGSKTKFAKFSQRTKFQSTATRSQLLQTKLWSYCAFILKATKSVTNQQRAIFRNQAISAKYICLWSALTYNLRTTPQTAIK